MASMPQLRRRFFPRPQQNRRKQVFREMKALGNRVARHARTHLEILRDRRDETDLTEGRARVIIERIEGLIVGYKLYEENPGDGGLVEPALRRLVEQQGLPSPKGGVTAAWQTRPTRTCGWWPVSRKPQRSGWSWPPEWCGPVRQPPVALAKAGNGKPWTNRRQNQRLAASDILRNPF